MKNSTLKQLINSEEIINFKKGLILKATFQVKKSPYDMIVLAKNEINYVKAVRSAK